MTYHYQDRPSRQGHADEYSPSSSGNATPTTTAPSSYLHSFVGGFGGLVRRFSDMTSVQQQQQHQHPKDAPSHGGLFSWPHNGIDGVYTPPINRSASPMRPPPLEPLELRGFREDTKESARLLTSAVAEEIRIMVPERQRIEDEWNLVYSLDQDGASLGTLYKKCNAYEDATRASFVLVVKDNDGGVSTTLAKIETPHFPTRLICVELFQLFGAYLSDIPRPQPHYFGNGECFLWRASVVDSILASLPPPPSEDTTHLSRVTTISSPPRTSKRRFQTQPRPPPPPPPPAEDLLIDLSDDAPSIPSAPSLQPGAKLAVPAAPTPPRAVSPAISLGPSIRFKAFPYSGENDFYIYCQPHWLSVGGGDGHYGLWLNDSLEKGISSGCPTFGNEPLSDEGEKFGIVGVEVWLIGRGGRR